MVPVQVPVNLHRHGLPEVTAKAAFAVEFLDAESHVHLVVNCIDIRYTKCQQWPMTRAARKPASARRDEVIQIRASAETKALLNSAARLRGQKLSEFMLESARRRAEEALLDQRLFILDSEAHEKFLKLLDAPPKPNAKLRALLNRKPIWQR